MSGVRERRDRSVSSFIIVDMVVRWLGGATHLGRLLLVHPYELLAVILNPTEFLKKKMVVRWCIGRVS